MVIDIIYIVALLIAIILGIRQGLLTQIFMLIAIVATAFVAPTVATPLGLMFTDNELLAFTAGFGIMLLGAVVLVWLVAPLLKRLIIGILLRDKLGSKSLKSSFTRKICSRFSSRLEGTVYILDLGKDLCLIERLVYFRSELFLLKN